jgi:hypothetical protein
MYIAHRPQFSSVTRAIKSSEQIVERTFVMPTSYIHRGRQTAVKAVTLATIAGAVGSFGLAGAASASATASSAGQAPAVVGPLLDFATFGDTIGLPLACGTAAGAISAGASQYGLAHEASSLVNTINTFCSTASAEGAKYIAQGQATDSPVAAMNPYANPILHSTGTSINSFGTTYGSALAPFGPTIAGLGPTVEWFEGR